MTTTDAAEALGVSASSVRRWVRTGDLDTAGHAGPVLLIDRTSVYRLTDLRGPGGRLGAPSSPRVARSVLASLSDPSGATAGDESGAVLATIGGDVLALRQRVRTWARTTRWATPGHGVDPEAADSITADPAVLGAAQIRAAESDGYGQDTALSPYPGRVTGVVTTNDLDRIVTRHLLRADPDGPVILHAVDQPSEQDGFWPVIAYLTLAASLDPRERSAGHAALGAVLRQWRVTQATNDVDQDADPLSRLTDR